MGLITWYFELFGRVGALGLEAGLIVFSWIAVFLGFFVWVFFKELIRKFKAN